MLKDKVVVITGAGSGLGRAMSIAFSNAEAKVIGLGRSEKTLEETKALDENNRFEFIVADTGDFAKLKKVIQKILNDHGKIDLVFNNAAVYPKKNFLDESSNEFANAITTNVTGVANICKAILPSMIKQGEGRIFNLGSWADLAPISNSAVYSASKGAVRALTKAIAIDLERHNVNVQVHEWIPGHLNTQMSDYTGIDPAVSAGWAVDLAQRNIKKPNSIFDRDQEWMPPKSFKQKIKDKILFWKK